MSGGSNGSIWSIFSLHLHADDVDVLAPGELELELGAVGVEVEWSFLIPGQGRRAPPPPAS